MNEIVDHAVGHGIDELTRELLSRDDRKRKIPQNWVTLDHRAIAICWDILRGSMAQTCVKIKESYLFKAPFRIAVREGDDLHLRPEYADMFENKYKEFARKFLACYMVLGIVPFSIVQLPNGHFVPCIPAEDTYVIQMAYATETEKRYYHVWRQKKYSAERAGDSQQDRNTMGFLGTNGFMREPGGRAFSGLGGSISESIASLTGMGFFAGHAADDWFLDENMHVIDGLGHDPHIGGSLNSPLASLIPDIIFTNSLSDNVLQAEYKMLNPFYLIQNHKNVDEGTKPGQLEKQLIGTMASSEMRRKVDESDAQTLESMVAFNRQLAIANSMGRSFTSSESNRNAEIDRTSWDHFARVPRGFEFVNASSMLHHVGTKYMQQREKLEDIICRAFGVPYSMVTVAGNIRGFHDAFRENFRNRLGEDAYMLESRMTTIFNDIYSNNQTLLTEAIYRRKPVVDDSKFTDLPKGRGKFQSDKIDVERDGPLAPVNDPVDMFVESVKAKPQEAPVTSKERSAIIAALKRENKKYKAKITSKEQRLAAAAEKEKESKTKSKGKKRFTVTGGMSVVFIINIPVDIHADAKMVKHACDVGAINQDQYREYLRFKIGVGRIPYKPDPAYLRSIRDFVTRTTGSEPPRVDAQKPESEDLGPLGSTYQRAVIPSVGGIVEAVKKRKVSAAAAKESVTPQALKPKPKDKSEK